MTGGHPSTVGNPGMTVTAYRVLLPVTFVLFATTASAVTPLRDGDIIFHTSRSAQSAAIQRATHSRWSHMGFVVFRERHPYVFEAVATVRYTPLAQWTARGEHGKYVVKRLKANLTGAQTKS